jgi:hypothetical protein
VSTTGRSPRTGACTIKHYIFILEQAALNKSNLLLTVILQNAQTLQLFTKIIYKKVFTKVIKMPSWMAWVQRPSGLIKMREDA